MKDISVSHCWCLTKIKKEKENEIIKSGTNRRFFVLVLPWLAVVGFLVLNGHGG